MVFSIYKSILMVFSIYKSILMVFSIFKSILMVFSIYKSILMVFSIYKSILMVFSIYGTPPFFWQTMSVNCRWFLSAWTLWASEACQCSVTKPVDAAEEWWVLAWPEQTQVLVGGWATPLKNMSSSIGMIIPNIWENKKWQPNHQPQVDFVVVLRLVGMVGMIHVDSCWYTAHVNWVCGCLDGSGRVDIQLSSIDQPWSSLRMFKAPWNQTPYKILQLERAISWGILPHMSKKVKAPSIFPGIQGVPITSRGKQINISA